MAGPYAYPTSNSQLIRKLEKHPEGGYFLQTVSLESYIPTIPSTTLRSAALEGREQSAWGPGATILGGEATSDTSERKVDATAIYYLLCPQSSQGKMHMNLHSVSDCTTALISALSPLTPGPCSLHLDQTTLSL